MNIKGSVLHRQLSTVMTLEEAYLAIKIVVDSGIDVDLSKDINGAFVWKAAPQKGVYWADIWFALRDLLLTKNN